VQISRQCTPFQRLGILPYDKILEQSKLLFMQSIEDNYATKAFINTWSKISDRNIGQALHNDNDYVLPHPRLEAFKKIPLYSLPLAWNNAGDIRFQNNRINFKIALKDKLLDEINNFQ
jgi:hypothetical protein